MPFGKSNYQLLPIGVLVIALGFTLIALAQEAHGLGVPGLTIGPTTVVIGFVIEFFAIMYRSKQALKFYSILYANLGSSSSSCPAQAQ